MVFVCQLLLLEFSFFFPSLRDKRPSFQIYATRNFLEKGNTYLRLERCDAMISSSSSSLFKFAAFEE